MTRRRIHPAGPEALFAAKAARPKIPFEFVLEALAPCGPTTRPFFGSTAVYVDDKIVFILRDKPAATSDNGVWVATTKEHHATLRRELPSMRSIAAFAIGETGWQVIPVDSDAFEEDALRACALVVAGDPRIGKVPERKKRKGRPAGDGARPDRPATSAPRRRSSTRGRGR